MQDFKSQIKRVSRRINYLENKVQKSNNPNSFDRAELSALGALLRVASVYDDARRPGGSHIENVLFMVRDVLQETIEESGSVLDEDTLDRLGFARRKCTEAIDLIHSLQKITDEDSPVRSERRTRRD